VPDDAEVLELTLWIDRGSDPVSGRLRERGAGAREFCGWIELIALLENTRRRVGFPEAAAPSDRKESPGGA
jgi:hypothetical protein